MINKVILFGRFAGDPLYHGVRDGTEVCQAQLDTENRIKDKVYTEHHFILAYGTLAIELSKTKAGQQAFIEGKLATRTMSNGLKTTEVVIKYLEVAGA